MFLHQHPQMTCAAEPLYFLTRTKLSVIVPVKLPTGNTSPRAVFQLTQLWPETDRQINALIQKLSLRKRQKSH